MNWQTFLENNLTTAEDLRSPLKLTDEEYENIRQEIACYPMSVTKYYFSLINPDDPDDPIRKLAIPTGSTILPDGELDTSGEACNTVLQGMQHKYAETVLILTTADCAMFCRHCFRRRLVGKSDEEIAEDIDAIADAITRASAGKRKPHFHVDCVQAAGKIPLEISKPGIDSAAFSAHKICGPRGTGLLYLAKPLQSFLVGGGQEQNIRSGTENVFGALAFADCLNRYYIKKSDISDESRLHFESQKKWTNTFISELAAIKGCSLVPSCRTEEAFADRFSPYVLQAAFKNIPGNVMVRALDAKGFAISTGSACSAKKQNRPILQAMGLSRDIQDTAVRFSFGPLTTEKGMQELLQAVREICGMFG